MAGIYDASFFHDVLAEASRQADRAEVFGAVSEETPVRFEANRLKEVQSRNTGMVAVRLIKGGRIGLAVSSGITNPRSIVNMALETAVFGTQSLFEFPSDAAYPEVAVYDEAVEKISAEQMVEIGQNLIDRIRRPSPELMCEGGVNKSMVELYIMNSNGGSAHYRKSLFSVGMEGTLVRGEDMLFVGDGEVSCRPILDTSRIESVTQWQLENAARRARVQTKAMPVILTPRAVAGVMATSLSIGFNGRTVFEGASPLKDKLGKRLMDAKLTVYDDPVASFMPESRPCDDEGVASRRNTLINQGEVTAFLYDLQTAGLAKTASTGSANRSRGGMPSPGTSCLVFEKGDTAFEDMISQIKEGLIVEHLMGAEQGNVLGGDFSGNVLLGFKIEGGKIAGRAKDVMVSGNVYTALNGIVAMGKDPVLVMGGINAPHIWLRELSVASKESQ